MIKAVAIKRKVINLRQQLLYAVSDHIMAIATKLKQLIHVKERT